MTKKYGPVLFSKGWKLIPLVGVKVDGIITGRKSKIVVTQVFKNVEDIPIEAIYKFPLPHDYTSLNFDIFSYKNGQGFYIGNRKWNFAVQ